MKIFLSNILVVLTLLFLSNSLSSKEYLENTNDIDRLKIWEDLRDSILPEASIEQIFDYTCLYLSINPANLDVYKGGFVRYGKVNKKKIQNYIKLIENETIDLTDCNYVKD